MTPDQIIDRAVYLKKMHDDSLLDRSRFRNILNGGEHGIRDLLGAGMDSMDSYTYQHQTCYYLL